MLVFGLIDNLHLMYFRLDKEATFTALYRSVISSNPADLEAVIYLSSNNLSPAYEGLELGIGDSVLVKHFV